MAMKGCSIFPKAPALLGSHHQTDKCHIQPQPTGQYLFLVMSIVQQTRVSWALPVSKAALWYNSYLQKFGNGMLYCLAFMLEAPIRWFQRVCVINMNLRTNSYPWKRIIQFMPSCSEWSLKMVTLFLHSSSHMASDTMTEVYIKCLEEIVLFWIKRVAAGRPYIWEQDCHVIQAGEVSLGCEKISATTSPITSSYQTLQIAISLIIMCRAWLSKRPTKLCTIPEGKVMVAITNLNKEIVRKACKIFWSHLETVVDANGDFFE